MERRLSLSPVPGLPGRVRGEWVTTSTQMWMLVNETKCRFGNEASFIPLRYAVDGYEITGELSSSGTLNIHGHFHDCKGEACIVFHPKPQMDFDSVLRVSPDMLVDTNNTPGPEDDIYFHSQSSQTRIQAEVTTAIRPILQYIDREDVEGFFANVTSEMNKNTSKQLFAETMHNMHSQAMALSREVFRLVPADTSSQVSKDPGEFALLINHVYLTNNRETFESIFLQKVKGQWRVDALFWA
jgi:hypothetical protein